MTVSDPPSSKMAAPPSEVLDVSGTSLVKPSVNVRFWTTSFGVARLHALLMCMILVVWPPLSVTRLPPSMTVSTVTGSSAVIVMVMGAAPQSKMMVPPPAMAAARAASVQLAGEPSPTMAIGLVTLASISGRVQVVGGGGGPPPSGVLLLLPPLPPPPQEVSDTQMMTKASARIERIMPAAYQHRSGEGLSRHERGRKRRRRHAARATSSHPAHRPVARALVRGEARRLALLAGGSHRGPAPEPPALRAAATLARARGELGLPVVPERAAPPHAAMGPGDHVVRPEVAVLRRVPLTRELREAGGKRVRDRDAQARAERTTAAQRRAVANLGLPFVVGALATLPPDPPARGHRDVAGRELAVLRGVPLAREGRQERGQRALGRDAVARAVGASVAPRSIRRLGGPFVPVRAAPPDDPVGLRQDVLRPEGAVPGRVPFEGQ